MQWRAASAGLLIISLRVSIAASPVSTPRLTAPIPAYRIKLDTLAAPPDGAVGMLVKARINGGPPLRLLLDSGSQYLVLDRKAALKSGCAGGADLELVGAGAVSASVVKRMQADTVQVGDLKLMNVPLLISGHPLADGIQGVLPLSIFAGFLIRLDIPGKGLDLLPQPSEPPDATLALRLISNNQLLFVKASANNREGYFLLDTGSSYTAVSRSFARQLNLSDALAPHVPLRGGVAQMEAPLLTGSVRLHLGSRELLTGPVVAVDLSTCSRYHDLEVSGLIGYSALYKSVLTISYRDSLLWVSPK